MGAMRVLEQWGVRIRRLIRNPLGVLDQARLYRDYRALKKWDDGRLSKVPDRVPKGDVLIVSLSGMIYSTKLEAMLGKALQLEGYRPVVLTMRGAEWPQRYFRAFGIDRFVYLDDFNVSEKDIRNASLIADEFLAGEVTFPTVKKWTFEGAPFGQYALSTVARMLLRGMPDLADPVVRAMLREQLIHALTNWNRAQRILAGIAPKVCLFNEINYTDYGPIFAAAYQRGLNVIQFVHALRDCALIFKRIVPETYRMHPNSVSKSTLEDLDALPWTDLHEKLLHDEFNDRYSGKWSLYRRDQRGAMIKSSKQVVDQLGLDPGKKTVTVFTHILWDANLFYGEDLFDDNEHWFTETLKASCRNDKVNWIIKLHPAIKWKMDLQGAGQELNEDLIIREKIGELPGHVKILYPNTDINTYSIIQLTDVGVTIRGTIGMELAALGIPVVTAGSGRYSGMGFTIDSQSAEEYLDRLSLIHECEPLCARQHALAKRHALALFCLRPWVMEAFENVHDENLKGYHPLNPKLELKARDYADLAGAEDLRKFAAWADANGSVDYLEAWPTEEAERRHATTAAV